MHLPKTVFKSQDIYIIIKKFFSFFLGYINMSSLTENLKEKTGKMTDLELLKTK